MSDARPVEDDTPPVDAAKALIELGIKASSAYQRPDLEARLRAWLDRLDDPHARVLVVGEFKQGKSSLINALLGPEVCPIDDDVATSIPTIVEWADELTAVAVHIAEGSEPPVREVLDPDSLPDWVTEAGNPDDRRHVASVEVGLPAPLLRNGLALVDTPGVGGLGSLHSARTVAALPFADAVIFVSDAAQELTEPEVVFLKSVARMCPRVLAVMTKIDLFGEWRKIEELDDLHLADAGLAPARAAISSLLRRVALERSDTSINEESGFPTLVSWLGDQVTDDIARGAAASATADVVQVAGHLREQFEHERSALADPDAAAALVVTLEQAQADAERLRGAAGRWQMTLSDSFSDASAEIDHDMRSRMRELNSAAEAAVDDLDPADSWAEFEPWLYQEVAKTVGDHLAFRHQHLDECTAAVAAVFGEDAPIDVVLLLDGAVDDAVKAGGITAHVDVKRMGRGSQALNLLRGSYGGVAMLGSLAGLAGLALATPATAGLGLLLGGKGLREERARQLAQRRAQGKVSVRRYLDEVSFLISKEERDVMRLAQRALRDHFAALAEEQVRSASAALDAARRAVASDDDGRKQRLAVVEAELQRIGVLEARATALAQRLVPPHERAERELDMTSRVHQ